MSTTKLKATQWAAQHTAGHDTHGQTAIYDEATGKDVAIVYDGDAHAQFIVCAVNAHANMLEALENLENDDNSIPEHAWKLVTDAITKARGGAA